MVECLKNPHYCKIGEKAITHVLLQHPNITVEEFKEKVCAQRQDFIKFLDSFEPAKKIEEFGVTEKERFSLFFGKLFPKCNTDCILTKLDIDRNTLKSIQNINESTERNIIDVLNQRLPTMKLEKMFQILKNQKLNETALKLCYAAICVTQQSKNKNYVLSGEDRTGLLR